MIRREPLGIVGGIAPWNYPLMMAVWKIGPALAAGNVQILKPSEQTPLTTLRFASSPRTSSRPGVLNVDHRRRRAGRRRGSSATPTCGWSRSPATSRRARTIARTAADTLKRVHLELGGKAPVIVFDDADPAGGRRGDQEAGYWNSGQDCMAASRVVAGPGIHDKLLDELVPAVESLDVGDPAEATRSRWAR